jgi:hypothetical protein
MGRRREKGNGTSIQELYRTDFTSIILLQNKHPSITDELISYIRIESAMCN